MSKTECMGKAEFYRTAAQELRELGCDVVLEEIKGQLKGGRGVRPADAVALLQNRVVVVEMKSPKEMTMLPLSILSGLRNDYLADTRRALANEVKDGCLARSTARHLLYLAQAEHYAHTFAGGAWTVRAVEALVGAHSGLCVGYCIPAQEERHAVDALRRRNIHSWIFLRGAHTLTPVYTYLREWQPQFQLPLPLGR